MFLKVNLKAGRDADEKKRLDSSLTYIPYSDKPYWSLPDWLYMEDNISYRTADGYYIPATLFNPKEIHE